MTFNPRFTSGKLTAGEARATVAMMIGHDEPDDIEGFALIAFRHIDIDNHELVIVSDRGQDRRGLDALIYLAHRSTLADILANSKPGYLRGGSLWDTLTRFGRHTNIWKSRSVD